MEGGHVTGSVQLDSAAGIWLSIPASVLPALVMVQSYGPPATGHPPVGGWQSYSSPLPFTNPTVLKGARLPVYAKSSLDALIFTFSCQPYSDMAARSSLKALRLKRVRIEGQQ